MSRNAWIIFVVICVMVLGGLVFVSRQEKVEVGDVKTHKIVEPSAANGNIGDHVFGSDEGKVVLVEYGDFQCPACKSAYPVLKNIKEEYKDDLTFIFRNNPITQIHPNAKVASAAAEAAGLQGKYWEMHDILYEQQNAWANASIDERQALLINLAEEIEVPDIDKLKADMSSEEINDKINFDLTLGRKDNVSGTPSIFLNGERVESNVWADIVKFKELIEKTIG